MVRNTTDIVQVLRDYEKEASSPPANDPVAELAFRAHTEIDRLRDALEKTERGLRRAQKENEIRKRAAEMWLPCPDHRDKRVDDRCIICRAEDAEDRLAAIERDIRALSNRWRSWAEDGTNQQRVQAARDCADELERVILDPPT